MKKEMGINVFLFAATCSVNLLSFCIGSAYVWTSPVLPKLKSNDSSINPLTTPITTFEEAWVASLLSLGAAIGPSVAGLIIKKIGRKKTLILFSVPMFLSHIICAFGTSIYYLFIGRFILGIGLGCVFSALPAYVAEISEDSNRGLLGSVMGLFTVLGALFNYAVGPFVSLRILSILNLVPIVLFYISFVPFVPESPYYYASVNNIQNAELSLKKLRNKSYSVVEKELIYIRDSIKEARIEKRSLTELFQSKALKKGLIISNGLMMAQQLSGICAVTGYLQSIFDASGNTIPSHISPIIIGAVQVVANIAVVYLADRSGRKFLLLISTTGCSVSLFAMGTYFWLKNNNFNVDSIFWFPVFSLIMYIVAYNCGLNGLPWTIMGELFSTEVKSMASNITASTCVSLAFVITMVFPYLTVSLGMAGTFWLFSCFCGLALLFTIFYIPETKGKSLMEIQLLLNNHQK